MRSDGIISSSHLTRRRVWGTSSYSSRIYIANWGQVGKHGRIWLKNTGLEYNPYAKTFTLDDDRWSEMIKANPKIARVSLQTTSIWGEARTCSLATTQLGKMLGGNRWWSCTGWFGTGLRRLQRPFEFMESFNTTNILDVTDVVDDFKQTRKKKSWKWVPRRDPHPLGAPWTRNHSVCRVLQGGGKIPDWEKEETNPRWWSYAIWLRLQLTYSTI